VLEIFGMVGESTGSDLGVHRTLEQTADYDPYYRYKTQIET
jgi:hypothetical protein